LTLTPKSRPVPVIVAGGSGTRLWPLSRELYPKPFLALTGGQTLLQDTLTRLPEAGYRAPLVICNEEHRFHILDQAAAIGVALDRIVLEPEGRNTAPALTAAALLLERGDPVMVMLPADHAVANRTRFAKCVARACAEAAKGKIATIGIVPESPETGYGYIHGVGKGAVRSVDRFVEKPGVAKAKKLVKSGEYLWNSGIYVVKPSVWLRAIRRFQADIHRACVDAVEAGERDGAFFRLGAQAFRKSPSDSVDYAVMERAAGDPEFKCVVVPFSGGWSDVGSWSAVRERGKQDRGGNVTSGDVVLEGTRNSAVFAEGRLVAALGIENLVIAETADAVLVADLDAAQSLGSFVHGLKGAKREEALIHKRVYRPWGSYEQLVTGPNYQVKRLIVKPGKKLSLQSHKHRSEHWVVVTGTATVVKGEQTLTLRENESVYLPQGTKHRLGNDGDAPLEVIEVQTGDYLGEDDIVRFDDAFGRK
jgi:mannose-1-phosphate guanylyltransferase/mannose-6-phosphate isomerase